jgi:hypothetical protein
MFYRHLFLFLSLSTAYGLDITYDPNLQQAKIYSCQPILKISWPSSSGKRYTSLFNSYKEDEKNYIYQIDFETKENEHSFVGRPLRFTFGYETKEPYRTCISSMTQSLDLSCKEFKSVLSKGQKLEGREAVFCTNSGFRFSYDEVGIAIVERDTSLYVSEIPELLFSIDLPKDTGISFFTLEIKEKNKHSTVKCFRDPRIINEFKNIKSKKIRRLIEEAEPFYYDNGIESRISVQIPEDSTVLHCDLYYPYCWVEKNIHEWNLILKQ